MISKMVAAGLAMAALVGSAVPMGPTSATPFQDVRVSAPAKPEPVRVAKTITAPRDENERVREAKAVPPRLYKHFWDGKNRSSGDRAHKRMKARRRGARR